MTNVLLGRGGDAVGYRGMTQRKEGEAAGWFRLAPSSLGGTGAGFMRNSPLTPGFCSVRTWRQGVGDKLGFCQGCPSAVLEHFSANPMASELLVIPQASLVPSLPGIAWPPNCVCSLCLLSASALCQPHPPRAFSELLLHRAPAL